MKELQKILVAEIKKQVKNKNANVEFLETLNKLLATVNSWLIDKK